MKFIDRILDNVHGFIEYTEAEKEIMNTLLFKRMQSIKQLSIANWIFPGSEHTRYIHSLGVMYVADKIAVQLELTDKDRKIIRLAGLLHDIGHYPLSHVCELPYKNELENYDEAVLCQEVNEEVKRKIEYFTIPLEKEFMKESFEGHHEAVGASLIRNDPQICKIITDECGKESIDIICDIITGNVKRHGTNPLLVQILHSEIDADGIDYMMRDAAFSGTGFGSFEMDQLVRCLEKRRYRKKEILCINEKGIAAADQYLINKFFSYSQVIYNKHISNLEWMSEMIVDWMIKQSPLFPRKDEFLKKWVNKNGNYDNYLSFTDNYFWKSLDELKKSSKQYFAPEYIVELCKKMLNHEELEYVPNSEIKIVSKSAEDIRKVLLQSDIYTKHIKSKDKITLYGIRQVTKHVPFKQFVKNLKSNIPEEMQEDSEKYIKDKVLTRFMEGICVCNSVNNTIQLLCDDDRSLMKQLYKTTLVVLRSFEFPVKDKKEKNHKEAFTLI